MTNLENIKQMSKEELASFLCEYIGAFTEGCGYCPARKFCSYGHNGMVKWLESEVEEDDRT